MLAECFLWLKIRSVTEWCLSFIIFVTTIAILIVLSNVMFYNESNSDSGPICLTKHCILAAGDILHNIDTDIDPCDNFYKFSCGNFIRRSAIAEDADSVSSTARGWDAMQTKFRKTFEKPLNLNDSFSERILKTIYHSCMNPANLNFTLNYIKTTFKSLGGWPVVENRRWNEKLFNWTQIALKLFERLGNFNLFFIKVVIQPDIKNNSQMVLLIDTPEKNSMFLHDQFNKTHFPALYKYYVDLAMLFGATRKSASVEMEQVIDFQRSLAQLVSDTPSGEDFQHSFLSLRIEDLQRNMSSFSWLDIINDYLNPVTKLFPNSTIKVASMKFLHSLQNLLDRSRKRVLGNYIFLHTLLYYLKHLPQPFRQTQQIYLKTETGQNSLSPRWSECINELKQLPNLLLSYYVNNFFDKSLQFKANNLLENIKETFILNLANLDWMDQSLMKRTARTVNKIKEIDLFKLLNEATVDKFYESLVLQPGAYYFNVLLNISLFNHKKYILKLRHYQSEFPSYKISSFYDTTENQIYINPVFLQNYLFDPNRPNYINYGVLGFIIAKEVLHKFNMDIVYNNECKNMSNFLEPICNSTYMKKLKCFSNQYKNNIALNVTEFLQIEDNGAVSLAYKSYKKWTEENNVIERKLPGLSYTPQQLFWISLTNLACTKLRTKKLEETQLDQNYFLLKNRIMTAFKNSEYFNKDFHCGLQNKMNLKNKCNIW